MQSFYWSIVFTACLAVFIIGWLAFFAIRSVVVGLPVTDDVRRRAKGRIFGVFIMEFWYWLIRPIEKGLIAARISANTLSLFSMLLSFLAGYFFAVGHFAAGGWLVLLGATFDIFDGRVARALGTAGKSGAFIDSTLDRYGEFATLFGLAIYYRDSAWLYAVLLSIAGSAMVSYTRARGEALGVNYAEGLMQRAERAVFLGVACALAPLLAAVIEKDAARPIFHVALGALAFLAVMANYSALSRMRIISRRLLDEEKGSAGQRGVSQVVQSPSNQTGMPCERPQV
jgi:CDP-diacylglycerol---glycerol-3-phosphate 3-phosphatidyltransferase